MRGLALSVYVLSAAMLLPAQEISGDWHGSIEVVDDAPLRLALHIAAPNTATVDSADEGVSALPVDSITFAGAILRFEIKSIAGAYQGTLNPDGSRINGTWTQDGGSWPLNWERGEDPMNIVTPMPAAEAMKQGRTCTRWFYEGNLTDLWRKLSPVARQFFVSEEQFAEFRQQRIQRMGPETQILSESVNESGVLQIYRRAAQFKNGEGPFDLQLAFNPLGAIAAFSTSANAANPSR